MMDSNESSPTTLAWKQALESLKKSLPPKDLERLQLPVSIEDLVHHVDGWLASKPGKTRKAINVMGQTVSRIQRFSSCVDQLAQGSPAPASLLWGSIKFVLIIIEDVSEEYDKICHALTVLFDSLPRVDIYADAFSQSYLVQQGVHDLFVSVLHFWIKACKFYRRRAIWNFMRSTWNDYNSEFLKLETSITKAVDRIEKGALAEHIKDSRTFISEQRQRNVVQDSKSETQSNLNRVFAPLLPPNEDMDYYVRDNEMARQKRHPSTCNWILHHPKFQRWSQIPAENGSQLWINAGPGVGKTVLTSFIIDHFLDSGDRYKRPILLYFYFKDSSLHNKNATAATCSIAYQLHKQQERSRYGIEMNARAIYSRADDKGKSSFPEVWRLLSMFLAGQPNLVLILDALDECEDNSIFLPRLLEFAITEKINLLLISRRQKRLVRYLEQVETLEITPEDVHHDIEAFVQFKVARNVRLSHPLVRDIVIDSVLNQHNGMFLWVVLMLKELKACISVEEVRMTLMQIPSGLEGLYSKIIRRLEQSLTRRAAEVAKNVLTWVLGSARNLTMDELREALSCQYQAQGHTLLSDGEFPYADKEIENMCGSLISIRHGQIQTVHQSTKRYLIGLGEDRRLSQGLSILPTSVDTSLQLASVCLMYQEELCKSSLTKLQWSPFDHQPEGFDIRMLQTNKKLLEYSFFFWIHHVLGCPIDHRDSVVAIISNHFSNFMTVSWILVSMLHDSTGLWRLLIGIEEVEEWLLGKDTEKDIGAAVRKLQDWCSGTAKLLKAYSTMLLENPWTIWRLDLQTFLGLEQRFAASPDCFDESKESEESLQSSTVHADQSQTSPGKPTLGHNEWSLLKARLGFFVHDQTQNIFLSGEKRTSREGECLFVQHAESGKRLSPATAGMAPVFSDKEYHHGYVITAKISAQGKYLAVAYDKWLSIWTIKPGLKFSPRLRDRAWAFRLISEKYHEEQPQCKTDGIVAFAEDDKLYAPGGWYDLTTKEFHAFQSVLSGQHPYTIYYSANCRFLFSKRSESSKEVNRQSLSPVGLADSITTTFNLDSTGNIKSSNTGRYIVLFDGLKHAYGVYGSSKMTLFDVELMEMKSIPILKDFSSFGDCSFQFSEKDEILVTFLLEPDTRRGVHARMTVAVWGLSSGHPKLCSHGQIETVVAAHPATIINPPMITVTARDLAWIVSCDRTVQVVKFNTEEISFPGYNPSENASSMLHSQVSQDGNRLGMLRRVGSKVDLEVINLLPSLQEASKLEQIIPDTGPISLSPNFDLLTLGRFALTIALSANELPPRTICDIDLTTPARDWQWACNISSCGGFLAFDKPAYKHFMNSYDRQPGRSVLFRVDRVEQTATRLTTAYPEHAQAASFDFHPSLPLAVFSSSKGEGSDNNQGCYRNPRVPASEIDSSMIHLEKDKSVPLEPLQLTHRVSSKLYFADTGDFLLLEGENHQSRIIVSDLPYPSQPLRVIPADRYIHPSKDRSYMLGCRPTSIDITMYKFESLAKDRSLPAYQALESTAKVEPLTVFPSTIGWPSAWLLLGDDYNKPLRMLLQPKNSEPIVMKTLMVSWNELRARLETTLTPVEKPVSA